MSQLAPTVLDDALAQELSERLADVFRTADAGAVLADDVFLDGHPPLWRFQLRGRDAFDVWIKGFMPEGADTTVVRTIPTVTGFVTEFTGYHHDNGAEITDRKILLAEVRRPHHRAHHLLQRRLERRAPSATRRGDPAHPTLSPTMSTTTPRQRMLAGLPAATQTVDVDGVSTSVIEAGDGPPLLLLHGGIECGGPMWAPVLTRSHGTTGSWRPTSPGSVSPLRSPFSMSTPSAAGSRALPSTPASSVPRSSPTHSSVASPPATPPAEVPLFDGSSSMPRPVSAPIACHCISATSPSGSRLRPTARNAERFDRFALLDLDATRQRDPDWYDAFETYTRSRARDPDVKRTMRRLVARETRPIPDAELDHIDVPITLLWGRHDRMVPLPVGEAAASRHGWPLHIIDGAAHAPHIEQPEAFVDTLTAIMSAPEPQSGLRPPRGGGGRESNPPDGDRPSHPL